jgi:hypothetical protein
VSAKYVSKFFHRESQPEKADLSEEFDSRRTLSMRRVQTITLCTLATFASQNLAHQVLANATVVDIDHQPSIKEAADSLSKEVTPEPSSKAIASPESLPTREFISDVSQPSKFPSPPPAQESQNVVVSAVASPTPIAISSSSIAPPETEATPARTSASTDSSMSAKPSSVLQIASTTTLAEVKSKSEQDLQNVPSSDQKAIALSTENFPTSQKNTNPQQTEQVVAQGVSTTTQPCLEVEGLQSQLRDLKNVKNEGDFQASPALSIVIPTGFGADNNTGFISGTFQSRTRYSNVSDGGLGIGVGLGDARKAVGVELSYTAASFGGSRDFGAGGFNVKVHRQLADDLSVAAGWNGFLNLGGRNDFENSVYGSATKIFRTRDDINLPFSRVAVTAGIGNGQFRSESAVTDGADGVNVFGNVAVRVAQPVSLIAEWSGQDLGVGVSIAPFKNIPLVITPALRDITGAGNGARFVLGTGMAFKF